MANTETGNPLSSKDKKSNADSYTFAAGGQCINLFRFLTADFCTNIALDSLVSTPLVL